MANCVDPEETARYEPFTNGLHMYLFWSAVLKGLNRCVFCALHLNMLHRHVGIHKMRVFGLMFDGSDLDENKRYCAVSS